MPDIVFMSVCVYVRIILNNYHVPTNCIHTCVCTVCGCVRNNYVHVSTLCDSVCMCVCVCLCVCIY